MGRIRRKRYLSFINKNTIETESIGTKFRIQLNIRNNVIIACIEISVTYYPKYKGSLRTQFDFTVVYIWRRIINICVSQRGNTNEWKNFVPTIV